MNENLHTLITLDRIIHEPARLVVMVILATVEEADFLYLLTVTKLTKGNLSSHLSKLEVAGYVSIEKTFVGKIPRTICQITTAGQEALNGYKATLQTVLE